MKSISHVIAIGVFSLLIGCQEILTTKSSYMPLSEVEAHIAKEAEELGRLLYDKDQCAARATDLLFEKVANPDDMGIRGWIVCKSDTNYVVIFVSPQEDGLVTPCQVIFKDHKHPHFIQNERYLTYEETAMFTARQHFENIIKKACSDKYNTVVLPKSNGGGWLVYALAATTDPQTVVAGGHYRATVSGDGQNILSQRAFTKSCLNLPKNPPDMPPGVELAAYTVSHILDDVPTEVHVFLSLLHKKPFYVATRDGRSWYVEGDKIKLLK